MPRLCPYPRPCSARNKHAIQSKDALVVVHALDRVTTCLPHPAQLRLVWDDLCEDYDPLKTRSVPRRAAPRLSRHGQDVMRAVADAAGKASALTAARRKQDLVGAYQRLQWHKRILGAAWSPWARGAGSQGDLRALGWEVSSHKDKLMRQARPKRCGAITLIHRNRLHSLSRELVSYRGLGCKVLEGGSCGLDPPPLSRVFTVSAVLHDTHRNM